MTVAIYCGGAYTYAWQVDMSTMAGPDFWWICAECGKRVKVVW